jgi:hypothetical protein
MSSGHGSTVVLRLCRKRHEKRPILQIKIQLSYHKAAIGTLLRNSKSIKTGHTRTTAAPPSPPPLAMRRDSFSLPDDRFRLTKGDCWFFLSAFLSNYRYGCDSARFFPIRNSSFERGSFAGDQRTDQNSKTRSEMSTRPKAVFCN